MACRRSLSCFFSPFIIISLISHTLIYSNLHLFQIDGMDVVAVRECTRWTKDLANMFNSIFLLFFQISYNNSLFPLALFTFNLSLFLNLYYYKIAIIFFSLLFSSFSFFIALTYFFIYPPPLPLID